MLKNIFDFTAALLFLILLSPVLACIAICIKADSRGNILFVQQRIGKGGKPFGIFKFRTMRENTEKEGQLTIGVHDPRITRCGRWLRKYKLDELPQLLNVLNGTMSLVGPRPEVARFVSLYNDEQKKVLNVKPGITDYASLKYAAENELLDNKKDPEQFYVQHIMPDKLQMNIEYLNRRNFLSDLNVLLLTFKKIFIQH